MRVGLGFDTEQEELRRSVRSFLDKHSHQERVREVMATESGMDDHVWNVLARDIGCHGLTVPEKWHGAGATPVEQSVVLEELGRNLACIPYFATVALALPVLLRLDDDEYAANVVSRLAVGDLVATVALCEPGGNWDLARVVMEAESTGDGWTLSGVKTYVPDGHLADLVLVVARADGELAVFAIEGSERGVTRTQLPTMDQTRRQALIELTDVHARRLGPADASEALRRALAEAAAFLAVEQAGAARHVLEATTEYVKLRTQFGVPIGSFQAVKHRLADMLLDVEAARSAAYYAVVAAAADDDELLGAASLAKAFCSDALVRAAEAAVQLHGGIGLTWEHWAHLYFKRARSAAVLLGSSAEHRERLATAIGL